MCVFANEICQNDCFVDFFLLFFCQKNVDQAFWYTHPYVIVPKAVQQQRKRIRTNLPENEYDFFLCFIFFFSFSMNVANLVYFYDWYVRYLYHTRTFSAPYLMCVYNTQRTQWFKNNNKRKYCVPHICILNVLWSLSSLLRTMLFSTSSSSSASSLSFDLACAMYALLYCIRIQVKSQYSL